jgi:hypothetical protein
MQVVGQGSETLPGCMQTLQYGTAQAMVQGGMLLIAGLYPMHRIDLQ